MIKGEMTNLCTSFLNAIDASDKMRKIWGRLFHNGKYLTVEAIVPTDVFVQEHFLPSSRTWQ